MPVAEVLNGAALVPCSNGLFAIVDQDDWEFISQFTWYISKLNKKWYVVTSLEDDSRISLHRLLMGEPPEKGLVVDHRNGLTIDCRRENLRWATPTQNAQNSVMKRSNRSGLKGVTQHRQGLYQARIRVNGRRVSLGYFETPEAAGIAYATAAKNYFGEFANVAH